MYNFINDKIISNLDKFNKNIVLELNDILNLDIIIRNISKILFCTKDIKFCDSCCNCNLINTDLNSNIFIINNNINNKYFNNSNIDYEKYIIDNIFLPTINFKFKLIFIYNINLLSNNIKNLIFKKLDKDVKYIKFIFICNNINNLNFILKTKCYLIKIDNYNINYNINILKKKYNKLNYKSIITSLRLSNNSIIKSYFILNPNNWIKRIKFINLLKSNFLEKKSLIFILNLVNFNEIEIYNPIFWLLTFILDSIKYKNNFNICIKNIDSINILKIISDLFSYNILNIILDKLIEYFYIINKNINIDKSFILIKNILYIESII
ncbi:DNA polymerase III subunit delta' C-terminal domain-containing protein [endosymbiont of Pachyrhynchus infernalis]|uniref:DNA polymerase III subunit delta' C-terminal domain-containing protein n=1 Tax=endosymbiont of Pachyrhynchus infernalis TaxID=1971488 RepID=UPI000DC721A1|nr:DNA polymerase III subunit delta' C-terminal domain-containing protein [endosymbiont of Pachyrhynchus infernalis]BBA84890.1 DNA polymerase III delta prime subunit [endosymbiont of Pachyrhynchus infernalis]